MHHHPESPSSQWPLAVCSHRHWLPLAAPPQRASGLVGSLWALRYQKWIPEMGESKQSNRSANTRVAKSPLVAHGFEQPCQMGKFTQSHPETMCI
jgi:hypothetical protein